MSSFSLVCGGSDEGEGKRSLNGRGWLCVDCLAWLTSILLYISTADSGQGS